MIEYIADHKNCLQCCVAGLFDLQLDRVPEVMEFATDAQQREKDSWYDSFYEWCKDTIKHIPIVILEENSDDTLDDLLHVMVYENRKGITHAVVCKGQELRWDPALGANHPDHVEPIYRILFIPLAATGGIDHNA